MDLIQKIIYWMGNSRNHEIEMERCLTKRLKYKNPVISVTGTC